MPIEVEKRRKNKKIIDSILAIMREYEGRGTLHFPWFSIIEGAFRLTFKENGKAILEFIPEGTTFYELLSSSSDERK